jgi:hypothetical protein
MNPVHKTVSSRGMGHLKYAVDHWWPHLDDAGKVQITAYFLKKTERGCHE